MVGRPGDEAIIFIANNVARQEIMHAWIVVYIYMCEQSMKQLSEKKAGLDVVRSHTLLWTCARVY